MPNNNRSKNAIDYPYIRAWERMVGAHPNYIENKVRHARESNAPHNAIYKDNIINRWITFDPATCSASTLVAMRSNLRSWGVEI